MISLDDVQTDTHCSSLTGKSYVPAECVYVTNIRQACKYIRNGATVIDLFANDDGLCFVFGKAETYDLYQAWKEHRLE